MIDVPAGGLRGAGFALLAAALSLSGLSACGPTSMPGDGGAVSVVAGFYPLQFVAEQVGGDGVSVTNLAQPGAEPHDMELSPSQVAGVADADLVLYIAGFQPSVDEAVTQKTSGVAVDAGSTVSLLDARADHGDEPSAGAAPTDPDAGGNDPHLWLDPTRLATVADAVAEKLAGADPEGAAGYQDRSAALKTRLTTLDEEFARGLMTCQRREIVVSHAAFGYLADRYDLEQISITGLSPEVEPTPQRLADVAREAKEHGATTIFFETLVSPKVAGAIADEVGAATAVLDPIEGLQPGSTGDYLSVMRANLSTLKPALGCM